MSTQRELLQEEIGRLREMKRAADRSESSSDRQELQDEINKLEAELASLPSKELAGEEFIPPEGPYFEERRIPNKKPQEYINEMLRNLRGG